MPVVPIILWTLVALAPLATIFAVWRIVTGPRLISKLMFRYLMKRRIAWVSLVAVMLCTAMVLIVISVMGGWLRMFRQTNHDLIGDLIVYRISLDGFEHYQDMLDEIRKIPEVKAATPTIRTFGLAEIGLAYTQNPIRTPVEVVGLDIKQIGQVNGFVKSLHLQKDVLLGKADELAGASAQTQREAATRISGGDNFEPVDPAQLAQEESATANSYRAKAASFPSWDKPLPDFVYRAQFPEFKGDAAKWGGIIVGSGVIGLRSTDPRDSVIYRARVKLTVLKVGSGESGPSLEDKTSTNYYWLIDDSHTGVYQADQGTVYLPFDVLQKQLDMGASNYTLPSGEQGTESARCTEILISLKPDADPYSVKTKVSTAIDGTLQKFGLYYPSPGQVRVETWDEHQQDFLNAVEHEKSLLVILFAIISVVAIFLIFCIFFMIDGKDARHRDRQKRRCDQFQRRGDLPGLRTEHRHFRRRYGAAVGVSGRALHQPASRVDGVSPGRENLGCQDLSLRHHPQHDGSSRRGGDRVDRHFVVGVGGIGAGDSGGEDEPGRGFALGINGRERTLHPRRQRSSQELPHGRQRNPGAEKREFGRRPRRIYRHRRAQRLGQEHAAAHPGRLGRIQRRRGDV